MWTMAPADMPLSAPAGGYHSQGMGGVAHASGSNIKLDQKGAAPLLTSVSTKAPVRIEAPRTVLSPSDSDSPIAGGNAECYDDVRGMLCTQPPWAEEKEKVLLEPYQHLASRPGKEIRSHMIEAFNIWLGVPEDKIRVIHKVVGMLHTSSLLIDDVEDDSVLRRGAPVAHAIYGIPQTINTANYVYFLVFGEILNMNRQENNSSKQIKIQQMIVEEMINLHRGQGMDLYWRDNLVCPTEAEYIEMVNNKTSGLLRIVIKLMVANSPLFEEEDSSAEANVLIPLVNLIGLLFQIRDDYINLQSGDYAQNKGYCEDLTEGKFSFPLIHSIRASGDVAAGTSDVVQQVNGYAASNGASSKSEAHFPSQGPISIHTRAELLAVLQRRPKDANTKQVVVEYMDKQTSSFAYTRDVMARIDRLVHAETASLEAKLAGGTENARLRGILAALRKGWS